MGQAQDPQAVPPASLFTTPTLSLRICFARPGPAPSAQVLSETSAMGLLSPFVQEATGPGGSRAINNLRRSNSTTQVHQPQASQAWSAPLR